MGNLTSSLKSSLNLLLKGYSKDARILMLGLDAAGKTTIMYQYKLDETLQTIPTIGFNVETVQINKIKMTMWDIGGQNKIRPLWKHYYQGADSLIWVIDSADTDRYQEVKEELEAVLREPELENVKILILANKSDLVSQSVISQLPKILDIENIARNRKWHIQSCCATKGEGLYEGMNWLCEQL